MDELAQVFSAPFLNRNPQHDDYVEIVPCLQISSDHHQGNTAAASLRLDAFGEEEDFSDATLRLINQMLMEEDDLQNKPCMFQECLALQATENSFYDALGNDYLPPPPPPDQNPLGFDLDRSFSIGLVDNFVDQSNWLLDRDFSPLKVLESSDGSVGEEDENKREKKTRGREDGGDSAADGGRSNKQLASSAQDFENQFEMYDKVLLCPLPNPNLHQDSSPFLVHHDYEQNQKEPAKGSNVGGRGRVKKERSNENEVVVDLMNLLSLCAQAVSNTDHKSAYDLLNRIRQHSSPYGDGIERLGHYFGNALEARLAGTGAALYASFTTKRISTADILRGYEVYVKACPFNWLSNRYANRLIEALVQDSPRLHVIDFGIMYGFQWPSLIQDLSTRPGGPPRLKITGIDFPQPGFRPSERVEETRRRLATYCDRFRVPFQFNAIAKKWESINLDDLKIESDEVVVVNCMFRLRNVPDETVEVKNCPRDTVLNLVKRINPDTFIHGVLNGGCDAPFFTTRFKEALSYSARLFDMFEATILREDEGRRMYEKEVWGKAIMNVIACEDAERVERPETYKQWQVRNARAGFRQLPLNQEILRELKGAVRLRYNKNFTVEEDGKWMLQGWKGRIMFALSCWKPIKEL